MVRNYSNELEKILQSKDFVAGQKLMLHTCCAPCSSYVIEYLSDYFEITTLFYNPNLDTREEFLKRQEELSFMLSKMKTKYKVNLIKTDWRKEEFLDAVKGMEHLKEGSTRCEVCFRLRLLETVKHAKAENSKYFTTTLSISPMKNSFVLNEICIDVEKEYNIEHLPSDFKKKGGYQKSVELSKKFGLYRQNYCGCEFSKNL